MALPSPLTPLANPWTPPLTPTPQIFLPSLLCWAILPPRPPTTNLGPTGLFAYSETRYCAFPDNGAPSPRLSLSSSLSPLLRKELGGGWIFTHIHPFYTKAPRKVASWGLGFVKGRGSLIGMRAPAHTQWLPPSILCDMLRRYLSKGWGTDAYCETDASQASAWPPRTQLFPPVSRHFREAP